MRIIAGRLRGRTLDWPKSRSVRPMPALVREALFNITGPVDGQTVLDAYAGSGSVGFEALSRGANRVEAVEILPAAQQSIRRNAQSLAVESSYQLHAMAIEKWLHRSALNNFSLIVAGPPYATLSVDVLNQLSLLLAPGGLFVIWHSGRISPPELQSLQLTDSRRYGDSSLSFYKSK